MTLTPMRIALAAAVSVLLVILLLWQNNRVNMIAKCAADGGVWNGRQSLCAPQPPGILIERELKRT
jgi:hypothetical protein